MAAALCGAAWRAGAQGVGTLPLAVRFRGQDRFDAIARAAVAEGWAALPIGQRMRRIAFALEGVPYVNYTLEIDDRVEAASANFNALDCWTFMEIVLDYARLMRLAAPPWTPEALLREIERTRYYGGEARGDYLRRIHYLEEWYPINARNGVLRDLTRELGGERMSWREIREMTVLWRSYRYLRASPGTMLPRMRAYEARLANLAVWHVPKERVARIEPKLQDGDVIGISTRGEGAYCSHVGLAFRDSQGTVRFMHASKNNERVVVDRRLSAYLSVFKNHAGILIGRPIEVA